MSDAVRQQLVDAGLAVLERDGLAALSVRKLAAEVGTSTMAVYTHFGSMTGVIDAIADEAFACFTRELTVVPHTDDPVADFMSTGLAYYRFALRSVQRYQLMFGTAAPDSLRRQRTDLTVTGNATSRAAWGESFEVLRTAVQRMIDAGRIRDDSETLIAGRMWSVIHGAIMLEMAGYLTDGQALSDILGPLTIDLLVGMGDDRELANRSLAVAARELV